MTLTIKFKKDIQTLRGAVNGEFFLDVKNCHEEGVDEIQSPYHKKHKVLIYSY